MMKARATLVSIALALGATGFGMSTAGAAPPDGWWYYTDTGVSQAQGEGYRGQGVTVAVIDTPYNADAAELADATITSLPSPCAGLDGLPAPDTATTMDASHGTMLISLIVGNGQGTGAQPGIMGVAPGATILHMTGGLITYDNNLSCQDPADPNLTVTGRVHGEMLRDAVDAGADIIAIAGAIPDAIPVADALAYAAARGVAVVAAMPNDTTTQMLGIPASIAVAGIERHNAAGELIAAGGPLGPDDYTVSTDIAVVSPGDGLRVFASGASDDTWASSYEVGDAGNSGAAAITAGMLAIVKSKYPNATGNQLLQSLIRNTGPYAHELYYDPNHQMGYGPTSLPFMLEHDPTTYPDENPFLENPDKYPTAAQVAAEKQSLNDSQPGSEAPTSQLPSAATNDAVSPSPPPSSDPAPPNRDSTGSANPVSPAASDSTSGLPAGAWVAIAGGIVAALGGAIALVIVRSRQNQNPRNAPPPPTPFGPGGSQ